jgi:thermostable 8-oxoguanine DNA glycosylase
MKENKQFEKFINKFYQTNKNEIDNFLSEQKKVAKELGKTKPFFYNLMIQCYSSLGGSKGYAKLFDKKGNLNKEIQHSTVLGLKSSDRLHYLQSYLKTQGVRYANKKAEWIHDNLSMLEKEYGKDYLSKVDEKISLLKGRDEKINFVKKFKGFGPKYSRNFWMDIYDRDFRNSIAIDSRIQAIFKYSNLSHTDYKSSEEFLIEVANNLGMEGWELDRMLYNFYNKIVGK